jgi:hypothetical protein
MTNPLYDELASDASELIAEFGAPMVMLRKGPAVYDVNTSKNVSTDIPEDAIGLELEYDNYESKDPSILASDKKILLATAGVSLAKITTPQKGDKIKVGEVVYKIERVKPFQPGGVAIYFEIQARV